MTAAPLDTPVKTADGHEAGISRSETGDCNNALLVIREPDNWTLVEFTPSHARNLGRQLLEVADVLDGEDRESGRSLR